MLFCTAAGLVVSIADRDWTPGNPAGREAQAASQAASVRESYTVFFNVGGTDASHT
jgi:hypothetical protein